MNNQFGEDHNEMMAAINDIEEEQKLNQPDPNFGGQAQVVQPEVMQPEVMQPEIVQPANIPGDHLFAWKALMEREQHKLIDKTSQTLVVKQNLKNLFHDQWLHICQICHLPGHEAANCWVNSQMYQKTRSDQLYSTAWWEVKQTGKNKISDKKAKVKAAAKVILDAQQRQARIEHKKAIVNAAADATETDSD